MNPEPSTALTGARIFDGTAWHEDKALLLAGNRVASIRAVAELPPGIPIRTLAGGMLVPGFVDLQVNGGGGVLLNETPTADGIATICRAHRPSGTTSLLPTLVTDTPEITDRALSAGQEAHKRQIPGFLGLHLEGPHLSIARKGAHDPALIRPMTEADLQHLLRAAPGMATTAHHNRPRKRDRRADPPPRASRYPRQPRPFQRRLRHGAGRGGERCHARHASVQRHEPA